MTPDDPRHGTDRQPASERVPHCECPRCDHALRLRRRNNKLRQLGRPPRVPTGPVAAHVRALIDRGWTQANIATAAGVAQPTISETVAGKWATMKSANAAAILAVQGRPPQAQHLDPRVTIRQLQALAALGWPMREVCTRAGLHHRFGADLMRDTKRGISQEAADRITQTFTELCMTVPLNTSTSRHVRTWAARQGWAPPLAYENMNDLADDPALDKKYSRWMSFDERFWGRVDKTGDCWLWTGTLTEKGYGSRVQYQGEQHYPHQLAYRLLVGPIPDGLVIDHHCRVRNCVNPDHLEPVTQEENTRRGVEARWFESCPNNHGPEYRSAQPNGKVRCSECEREGGRRYYARNAERHKATGKERYRRRQESVDPVVVDRILAGEVVRATPPEREEVVRRWVADGRGINELARMTGWRVERYYRKNEVA
jgi:hypothetical protein